MWVDAATEAAIPLLRAHIDARVLFGDEPPEGVAAEWWFLDLKNAYREVLACSCYGLW
jgi:hypothetical protein